MPGVRPVQAHVVPGGFVTGGQPHDDHAPLFMLNRKAYRMIGAPPLSAGAVQESVIDVSVGLAPVRPVGAPGVFVARAAAEEADHDPLPMALIAWTWKM